EQTPRQRAGIGGRAGSARHSRQRRRTSEATVDRISGVAFLAKQRQRRRSLGFATDAYGDAGNPERERWFTRLTSAELLIDTGAAVAPSVCDALLQSRAKGLLQLFQRKGLLPRTLKFFAALGDLDAVRTALDENTHDLAAANESFICGCSFRARGGRV